MSLIRNGGFERGNVDFWTAVINGSKEISTLLPKYGTYCGKFTSGVTSNQYLINDDYIEVNPYDVMGLFAWVKSASARPVYLCMYMYDADYSYIGALFGAGRLMTGAYLNINTQIPVSEGVEYVQAGLNMQTALNEVFYIDGYSANLLKGDRALFTNVLLISKTSTTSSGNSLTDPKDLQMYNTFEADLIVTWSSGTNETLDLTIYELNQSGGKEIVGIFTQATGAGNERITLTHCTGRQLYTEYTIGGSDTPTFGFKVYVTGKR